MYNAEMWRLAIKIVFLLKTDIIFANYFINQSEVTWKDAQNMCNVTSVGDFMYTKKDNTELPDTFMAWTSSRNRRSDWTSFYGCLDVAVDMVAIDVIKKKLNQYFQNSAYAIESKSVFKCAYFCTTKGDVFTFFKHVCKCAYENELISRLLETPECIFQDSTKMRNIDEVYSISRYALPIFKFEKGLRTDINLKGGRDTHKHHCLAKSNGTFTTNRCEDLKMYTCDGGITGYGTWTTAYHTCLSNHASISKNNSKDLDTWLGYFMYEEDLPYFDVYYTNTFYLKDQSCIDKANEQCVVIRRNNISQSLTYQYRPCSDRLHVLCKDESYQSDMITDSSEPNFDKTMTPSITDITEIQKPDHLCIKITAGGAVTFAAIIIFLVGIIFIQRRKLANASYTTLTVRRDQNNYNEVPNQMSVSIIGQYYEMSAVSEINASGVKPTVRQNIDQIQHIDTTGYLIPSGMLETSGDYQTIAD